MASFVEDERVRRACTVVAGALFFYAIQQRFWPAPAGVLFKGVVIGGLTALLAFGLSLIYRSNRIINFAQGDLGGIPASLGALLVLGPGVPYLVAFPVAIASAIVLGAFVEFVFIRRFFTAPRLILTVVTIGVSQILAGVATALPRLFDRTSPQNTLPPPIDISFTITGVVFNANEVIALAVVPVVIALLAGFFRYTNMGIAIRASAESADRAALLGVPVKRVQTIVWIVATVLATTAIFLRAGILGLPIGSVLGPTILVRALAACVVGRMERFPTIFAASIALGILESSIVFATGRAQLVDPILFAIVIGALLFQRQTRTSRVDDEQSTWQASRQVRPIPRELINLPEVRWGVRILTGLGVLFLVALPLVATEGQLNLAAIIVLFAIVGISLVVLTGWAGQVSLGQIAFFGIGAGVGGYLSATRGWDLALACLGGGFAGALAALLIGLPALRIKGLFLAVTTLAFALATSNYLLNPEFITWLPTTIVPRTPLFGRIAVDTEARFYELCVASLLLVIAAVKGLRSSRTGRVLIGVRENARGAQAYGVDVTAAKLTGFAIAGFIAAFAGALFVHHQMRLGITSYSVDQSRQAFIQVVIGGLGSVPGAILGAVFIQGIGYFTTAFPQSIRPLLVFLTSGVGLIIVLLIIPGGFSSVFYAARDRLLRLVADRRGLLVPSLNADARQPLPGGLGGEEPPPLSPDRAGGLDLEPVLAESGSTDLPPVEAQFDELASEQMAMSASAAANRRGGAGSNGAQLRGTARDRSRARRARRANGTKS